MMVSGADPVRVGIIGAGMIGKTHSIMLRMVADRTQGSVCVESVYDRNTDRAQFIVDKWPGARLAHSADDLIGDPHIDAVYICTPPASHREVCIKAAVARKAIFCEKPLAMNPTQAVEMQAAIAENGAIAQVGLVLRFSPVFTVIKEMCSQPEAGRMLAVTMRDDQDFPTRGVHDSSWRNDPAQTGGGALIEHSVHDFDLLTWMFGPVRRVSCATRNLNGALGIEDFGSLQFEFVRGFHGQLISIWHRMIQRPSNRRLEVFCENLFIACDHEAVGPISVQRGDGFEERIHEVDILRRFEEIILSERPYLSPMRDVIRVPYALEDAAFVAAVRGECAPDPAFEAGVAVQSFVHAAYRSARTSSAISLESQPARNLQFGGIRQLK
ncbi:MAG TPA: Gfo/Idh/MocA family oxidoreductase [Candidatus Binataceae bacterium]|nr:Gfo/Idh/MocA family oxidoreductase [Candidatus Binataceae bacterium]